MFIFKQPNGYYGRFSTIVDCPTHYNLTKEDVIELMAEYAREDAKRMFERDSKSIVPYEKMLERCEPENLGKGVWEKFKKGVTLLSCDEDFKPHYEDIYPLTIIKDRYNGVYSGGAYTAWNLDHWDLPDGVDGCDPECSLFWDNEAKDYTVGKGATIMDALKDLREKLKELRNTPQD